MIFFILIFKIQSDNYSVSVPFSSGEDGRCNYGDDGCDKDGSGATAGGGDGDYKMLILLINNDNIIILMILV